MDRSEPSQTVGVAVDLLRHDEAIGTVQQIRHRFVRQASFGSFEQHLAQTGAKACQAKAVLSHCLLSLAFCPFAILSVE